MPLFIGNVFSTHDLHPEDARDPTFAFSRYEKRQTQMEQLPIRIEHEASLTVGKVLRSWDDDDGCKWILGHIDDSDLIGKYASLTVGGPGDESKWSKHQLYGGLSLGHVSTVYKRPDGSVGCVKEPKEISICSEPRRSGCSVLYVCRDGYKCPDGKIGTSLDSIVREHQASMSATPASTNAADAAAAEAPASATTTTTTTQDPADAGQAVAADAGQQQASLDFPAPEAMAQTMFKMERDNNDLRQQFEALQGKYAELEKVRNTELEQQAARTKTKAEALLEAVRQQYAESTNGQFGESEERILQSLMNEKPEDAHSLLTVMQTAHNQKNNTIQQLQQQLNDQLQSHQSQLKQQERNHMSNEVHRLMGRDVNRVEKREREADPLPGQTQQVHMASATSAAAATAAPAQRQRTSLQEDATMQQVRMAMRGGAAAVRSHIASFGGRTRDDSGMMMY